MRALNVSLLLTQGGSKVTWSPEGVKPLKKSVFERGVQSNQNGKLCLEMISWEKLFLKDFLTFFVRVRDFGVISRDFDDVRLDGHVF